MNIFPNVILTERPFDILSVRKGPMWLWPTGSNQICESRSPHPLKDHEGKYYGCFDIFIFICLLWFDFFFNLWHRTFKCLSIMSDLGLRASSIQLGLCRRMREKPGDPQKVRGTLVWRGVRMCVQRPQSRSAESIWDRTAYVIPTDVNGKVRRGVWIAESWPFCKAGVSVCLSKTNTQVRLPNGALRMHVVQGLSWKSSDLLISLKEARKKNIFHHQLVGMPCSLLTIMSSTNAWFGVCDGCNPGGWRCPSRVTFSTARVHGSLESRFPLSLGQGKGTLMFSLIWPHLFAAC